MDTGYASRSEATRIAASLCRRFEGLRLRAYYCPAGVITVGYGATGADIKPGMVVTEEWAEARLAADLSRFMNGALKYCPVLLTEPGALAAITDFALNLGLGRLAASTLRRRINARDWDGAREELKKWINGGGRKLPGLVIRREAEARLLP
jgi:lysozyme